MWTDQVAQTEIQKWLATNPGKLDGIIIQSASELGAVRALKQSGRDMVPITIGGEIGALCSWRKSQKWISSTIQAWPPGDDFELGWNAMMRTLEGQGPKVQSVLTRPFTLGYDDMAKIVDDKCNEDSDGWFTVGVEKWAPKSYLDNFFLHPADPEAFKP